MSTFAFRAALVREIKQVMKRSDDAPLTSEGNAYREGRLDVCAHILQLIGDEDL